MNKIILTIGLSLAINPIQSMQPTNRTFNFLKGPVVHAMQPKSMKRFVPYVLIGGGLGAFVGCHIPLSQQEREEVQLKIIKLETDGIKYKIDTSNFVQDSQDNLRKLIELDRMKTVVANHKKSRSSNEDNQ